MGGAIEVPLGRPVARLVASFGMRFAVLIGMLAVVTVAGIVMCTQAVTELTDDLEPAASANEDAMVTLTDMHASVEAWVASGQRSALDDYRQAAARLPGHQRLVEQYAAEDEVLATLVEEQFAAAETWIEQSGDVRTAGAGGPGSFEAQPFRVSREQFAQVREAHRATQAAFDRRLRDASWNATVLLRGTAVTVLVLTVLAWLAAGRSRRTLLAQLATPLSRLEAAAQRMARHEPQARAELTGPKEVRAVAVALNELADGQARARAVENRIQQELRVLDSARDDFVSNVSHELRTPLTTINGYLEMVAEEFEGRMEPRHERMLEASRRNVTRLRALIDDLLALSRAESRPGQLEPCDLRGLVADAVTDVRITAARRRVRIDVRPSPEPLVVKADRAMLHRAFLNLLTNAVKFSQDGGVVQVLPRVVGERVEVAFRDHGIGIPAAELDRLGSRFFRASNAVANEIAGTGLGLRIVQTIVDGHGGEVLIESREGQGTTVTVRLPVLTGVVVASPHDVDVARPEVQSVEAPEPEPATVRSEPGQPEPEASGREVGAPS